jgi:hydrogenase maturation protease
MQDLAHDSWDTLVLGIGNVLWADEGFGVRCVERLDERYELPDSARVMDGGTQGIFLLPWVRAARRLLLFDAIDFGLPPATLRIIEGADVPRYMGAKKVSMHQAGFQEVLATASLSGELPPQIALIGVQPELLDDYGGSLTPGVRAMLDPAVLQGVGVLAGWGIAARERTGDGGSAGTPELEMTRYERRTIAGGNG